MALDYEQQPDESAAAFRAFTFYRDLGPERSLAKAYAAHSGTDVQPGKHPGQWGLWSSKNAWESRALAYDAHCDEERRKARERKMRQLEERRFEFELRNQEALERRVGRMDELLDKAEATPVADVVVVKDETEESMQTLGTKKTRTKTVVKALKMAGYSRTVQVRNETAKFAITGVRAEEKKKADAPSTAVTGIVFKAKKEEA